MTIKIKVKYLGDTKVVTQAGDFKVGHSYMLTGGHHSGRIITLDHISTHKQVIIDGQRHRAVHGTLDNGVRVNSILAYLQ